MPSFTVLCAKFHKILCKKFLLSIVVKKLIFNSQAFSTKFHAHKMFGSREFRNISCLGSRQKVFADPLAYAKAV